ncbi:hypothetical protein C8Q79DRAFT_558509 [Trametes meyenii]|nr:hypothetical protein C8Q79DRAFT_558509 [Trametes meyenii]
MGSLRDPAEEARVRANGSDSGATTVAAPSPVLQPHGGPSSSVNSQSQPQSQPGPSQVPPSHASTPHPQAPVHPQHASLHPPGAYPYSPYPYALPQAQGQQPAYPHAPYYAPPAAYPSHYSYPYGPPPGYHTPSPAHSSPPPHAQGQNPLFSSSPLVRPPVPPSGPQAQPPPPPPPSEDLPSYEEMIVEALMDCGDSEGAAPKDLFTWMAGRYPLQTNFRPSASQALQKAYKRGRLEKRLGGKYRLNAAWEGGATSKRTTRRPQTLAQTAYAMQHPQPQSSPFTHAPLQQHPHPPAAGAQPPYAGYPYSYPYGYPGYPPHHPGSHPAQAKTTAQPASAPATNGVAAGGAAKMGEEKDESGDAWEAAQHILQAINFGDLKLATQPSSTAPAAGQSNQTAQGAAGVPPPAAATGDDDLSAVLSALVSAAGVTANAEPPRASLTEDERAALQAQLALLAAQLTEIAEGSEDDDASGPPPVQPTQAPQSQLAQAVQSAIINPPQPSPPTQSTQASQPAPQPPPPISAFAGTHIVLDVNAFPEVFIPVKSTLGSAPTPGVPTANTEPPAPASGHQTEVDELPDDDSDSDDDMEDVVVPLHPHPPAQGAVRT